ncbi:unnamed protein product [Fusarium langsethiae]|nr:unnamed protein product [Fusarium langsethiae]
MSPSAESIVSVPSSPNGINGGYPATTHKKLPNGDFNAQDSLALGRLTPYDVLTVALPLPAPISDTDFWWRETGPLMSKLFSKANCSLSVHYQNLILYYAHIVPLLGPRPPIENSVSPSTKYAPWRSFLTDDFSPLEPSWNMSGNLDSQSTIRLGIEPVGFEAGTAADPFNQAAVTQFMHSREATELCANLTLFEHFRHDLFVDPGSYAELRDKIPEGEHTTQSFMAFDFEAGRVTTKAYFFPFLVSLKTGLSITQVVSNSIIRLTLKSDVPSTTPLSA